MAIELKDIVTLIVAVYGAFLSTFNFLQSMRKERRQVSIDLTSSYYLGEDRMGEPIGLIRIVNHGQRPIVVTSPTIHLDDGAWVKFLDFEALFPKKLEDGESISLPVFYEHFEAALTSMGGVDNIKTLQPSCTLSTGKTYRGKKWRFDEFKEKQKGFRRNVPSALQSHPR